MTSGPKINDKERQVLLVLDENTDTWGEYSIAFDWIVQDTKLELKDVRRAARSLRKKSLAQYLRGLMTEDGDVAGSGYCITKAGKAFLHPCDVCGDEAIYEYKGKKECKAHYEQSRAASQPPML